MTIIYLVIFLIAIGILSFSLRKNSNAAPLLALLASIVSIGASIYAVQQVSSNSTQTTASYPWLPELGMQCAVHINGLSAMLCLLTSICFLLIVLSTWKKNIENAHRFFGLLILSIAGLLGVFIAWDAMLFYIFWELALIPVYFLASMWGGEKRITVSFKFFIYTFVGSLLMLVGLIFLYNHTPDHSFAWSSFAEAHKYMSTGEQHFIFWLLFVAFAIKMPLFPLHTWQPEAYAQSFTPVTMIMSAVMVKMGLFAVVRWLNPILPEAGQYYSTAIGLICVVGILYASLNAMVQTDLKKLVAYSSIAHISMMCIALFSFNEMGVVGAGVQMFHHGINIIGMWMLVFFIEKRLATKNLNEMGGAAAIHPAFAFFLVLITLANIAMPLTNAFVGEFMLFNGVFNAKYFASNTYNIVYTVLAGLGIILGAVYSLGMVQKVAYGVAKQPYPSSASQKLTASEWLALSIVVALILFFGFYSQPLIDLVKI